MQSLKMSPALTNGNPHSATFAPSQRRGPIAAEFQGPGPAAVALPSTIGTLFYCNFFLLRHDVDDSFIHPFGQKKLCSGISPIAF